MTVPQCRVDDSERPSVLWEHVEARAERDERRDGHVRGRAEDQLVADEGGDLRPAVEQAVNLQRVTSVGNHLG